MNIENVQKFLKKEERKLDIIRKIANEPDEEILTLIEEIFDKEGTFDIEEVRDVLTKEKCWICYEKGRNTGCRQCPD
jgi:7-cyano-7-deazaguanine synthase in queuosine biosynthesis